LTFGSRSRVKAANCDPFHQPFLLLLSPCRIITRRASTIRPGTDVKISKILSPKQSSFFTRNANKLCKNIIGLYHRAIFPAKIGKIRLNY
jgi:hypothetical protein